MPEADVMNDPTVIVPSTHPQLGEIVRYFPGVDDPLVFNAAMGLAAIITNVGVHPDDSNVVAVNLTVFTFFGKTKARENVPERTVYFLDRIFDEPSRPSIWCRPEALERPSDVVSVPVAPEPPRAAPDAPSSEPSAVAHTGTDTTPPYLTSTPASGHRRTTATCAFEVDFLDAKPQVVEFRGEHVTINVNDHDVEGFVIHVANTDDDPDDRVSIEISIAEAREIIQGLAELL